LARDVKPGDGQAPQPVDGSVLVAGYVDLGQPEDGINQRFSLLHQALPGRWPHHRGLASRKAGVRHAEQPPERLALAELGLALRPSARVLAFFDCEIPRHFPAARGCQDVSRLVELE
jgi:hypothetical protein